MLSPDYHFQMTRPGIALYGADPANQPTDKLMRVVTWQARIIQLRQAKAGDRVGYGGTIAGPSLAHCHDWRWLC